MATAAQWRVATTEQLDSIETTLTQATQTSYEWRESTTQQIDGVQASVTELTTHVETVEASVAEVLSHVEAGQESVAELSQHVVEQDAETAARLDTVESTLATLADTTTQLLVSNQNMEEQLRYILQLLAPGQPTDPPPAPRFPGDPGVHQLYWGESINGRDPSGREAFAGSIVDVFRSYFAPNEVDLLVATAVRDTKIGRIPFVSIKLPVSWADMAAGKQDAWLNDLMSKLSLVAGPVWLCLHHEPYDDQGAGQTPQSYVDMYRHAYPLKPANVAMVPILQSSPFDTTVYGHGDIGPWYDPAVTDIVGIDTYNHWYVGGKAKWRDPATMLGFMDVLAQKFNKPIAIAETGVRTDPAFPGKAAAHIAEMQRLCVARGDIVAVSTFDSDQNVNDGGTPWTLDYNGDQERLAAWATALHAPGSVTYAQVKQQLARLR